MSTVSPNGCHGLLWSVHRFGFGHTQRLLLEMILLDGIPQIFAQQCNSLSMS